MSIPSNYEINVSLNGRHWCKIQLPDCFEEDAVRKLEILRSMFGDSYNVSLTYWECKGKVKEGWR